MNGNDEWNLLAPLAGQEPSETQIKEDARRIERMRREYNISNWIRSGNSVASAVERFGITDPQEREQAFHNGALRGIRNGTPLFDSFDPDEIKDDDFRANLFRTAASAAIRSGKFGDFCKAHGLDPNEFRDLADASNKDISSWMAGASERAKAAKEVGRSSKRERELSPGGEPASKRPRLGRTPPRNGAESGDEYGSDAFTKVDEGAHAKPEALAAATSPVVSDRPEVDEVSAAKEDEYSNPFDDLSPEELDGEIDRLEQDIASIASGGRAGLMKKVRPNDDRGR